MIKIHPSRLVACFFFTHILCCGVLSSQQMQPKERFSRNQLVSFQTQPEVYLAIVFFSRGGCYARGV